MSTETSSTAELGMPAGAFADDEKGPIQSVERAAAVLSLLNHETRSLTSAIDAESLGLNRTTAHRYLQSLQKPGFLNGGCAPVPWIDQLSAFRSPRQRILDLGPSVLRQLADSTGPTAVLSFLGRGGAVVTRVEKATSLEESRAEVVELSRVRRERPAWADLGQVGLASAPHPSSVPMASRPHWASWAPPRCSRPTMPPGSASRRSRKPPKSSAR